MSTLESVSTAPTASLCAAAAHDGPALARHAADSSDPRRARSNPRSRAPRVWLTGLAAAFAWAAFGAITYDVPNKIAGFSDWAYTDELGIGAWAIAALLGLAAFALPVLERKAGGAAYGVLRRVGPWFVVAPLALGAWEALTAKTALLPTPFFAPPQALIEVYHDDWRRLGDSAVHSLALLGTGFAYGAVVGFLVGVSIGWSRAVGYWVHPVLRVLGPVPATALLPLAFYFFPSSYAAAVFLIALATSFPVAVLTWSGVAGVNKAWYDVARTLGANQRFLVLRVAIPAALPQVFVGLFMALSASFTVLVTAEMMGVKSGLGWYLTWAQGWASYSNMYGALIVMALLFSSLITLLFALRDRALVWQKGTVKW